MVKKIPGNGMCFVEAVRESLKDIGEKDLDVEVLKCIILNEMYNHMDYYAAFHPTGKNPRKVLLDAEKIFKYTYYTMDIVDVCIAATANALGVNLYIYEQIGSQGVKLFNNFVPFNQHRRGYFCTIIMIAMIPKILWPIMMQ